MVDLEEPASCCDPVKTTPANLSGFKIADLSLKQKYGLYQYFVNELQSDILYCRQLKQHAHEQTDPISQAPLQKRTAKVTQQASNKTVAPTTTTGKGKVLATIPVTQRNVRFLQLANPENIGVIQRLLQLRGMHQLEARHFAHYRCIICWITGYFSHRAVNGGLDTHNGILVVEFPELTLRKTPPLFLKHLTEDDEVGKKLHDYVRKQVDSGGLVVMEEPRHTLKRLILTLADLQQPGTPPEANVILVILDECFQALLATTKSKRGSMRLDKVVGIGRKRFNKWKDICDHVMNDVVTQTILHIQIGSPSETAHGRAAHGRTKEV